jgi:salicylate hydroxylase
VVNAVAACNESVPDSGDRRLRITVAIIGGGIAGVALAIGLARHVHLDVKLFEAAAGFGEVGAGVSFGPNAVRAVAGLGLEAEYAALADCTPAPFQDVWFDWRFAYNDQYVTSSLAPPTGQSSVHRAEFLELLVTRLPAGIAEFSRRAVTATQHGDRARVDFADGSHVVADLVLASDGIRSALRGYVLTETGSAPAEPEYSGTRAYRGLVDSGRLRDAFTRAGLDARLVDVPQMFLAPHAHLLTFPVRHGAVTNIVAFRTRPETAGAWPAGEPWVRAAAVDEMLSDFHMCGLSVRTILGLIDTPTVWGLHDVPDLGRYVHGRVALVGDAAHAMLPHQGAGAGQALEDAYFLSGLLSDTSLRSGDLPRVLEVYERIRKPRASAVQRTSREAGDLYELVAPGVGSDEVRLRQLLETRFTWIWDHDLEADVARGKVLLSNLQMA